MQNAGIARVSGCQWLQRTRGRQQLPSDNESGHPAKPPPQELIEGGEHGSVVGDADNKKLSTSFQGVIAPIEHEIGDIIN